MCYCPSVEFVSNMLHLCYERCSLERECLGVSAIVLINGVACASSTEFWISRDLGAYIVPFYQMFKVKLSLLAWACLNVLKIHVGGVASIFHLELSGKIVKRHSRLKPTVEHAWNSSIFTIPLFLIIPANRWWDDEWAKERLISMFKWMFLHGVTLFRL